MKTRTFCVAVVIGLMGVLPWRAAEAKTSFSVGISISNVNDFYEPLRPYGHWVTVANYGRCWYPSYVGSDWQPYADGHWEWTDQGWYWVSDESWAWATYHYGRWVYDPYYGWLWVPDTTWGPSWVSWREGGDITAGRRCHLTAIAGRVAWCCGTELAGIHAPLCSSSLAISADQSTTGIIIAVTGEDITPPSTGL